MLLRCPAISYSTVGEMGLLMMCCSYRFRLSRSASRLFWRRRGNEESEGLSGVDCALPCIYLF